MDRLLPVRAKLGSVLTTTDFPGVDFQIVAVGDGSYDVQNSYSGEVKNYKIREAQEYFVYQYDLKFNIFIHRFPNANNQCS